MKRQHPFDFEEESKTAPSTSSAMSVENKQDDGTVEDHGPTKRTKDDLDHIHGVRRVFVTNLKFSVDEERLAEVMGTFGNITTVKVLRDQESGRSRGIGFVTYATDKEAICAIRQGNGLDIKGREIKVELAQSKETKMRKKKSQNGDHSSSSSSSNNQHDSSKSLSTVEDIKFSLNESLETLKFLSTKLSRKHDIGLNQLRLASREIHHASRSLLSLSPQPSEKEVGRLVVKIYLRLTSFIKSMIRFYIENGGMNHLKPISVKEYSRALSNMEELFTALPNLWTETMIEQLTTAHDQYREDMAILLIEFENADLRNSGSGNTHAASSRHAVSSNHTTTTTTAADTATATTTIRTPEEEEEVKVHQQSLIDSDVGKDILSFYNMNVGDISLLPKRQTAIERFQTIISSFSLWNNYTVHVVPFGSSVSGLSLATSDLDICLWFEGTEETNKGHDMAVEGKSDPPPTLSSSSSSSPSLSVDRSFSMSRLRELASYLKEKGISLTTALRARIPLLRIEDDATPGGKIELSIATGRENWMKDALIAQYVSTNPFVGPLVSAVKNWSNEREVCNPTSGLLNSLSFTLITINFLQCMDVLPTLSLSDIQNKVNSSSFFPSLFQPQTIRLNGEEKKQFMHMLGSLFRQLTEKLSTMDFSSVVFSVRSGETLSISQFPDSFVSSSSFYVEDPVETNENTSRGVMKGNQRRIHREFGRAHFLLSGRFEALRPGADGSFTHSAFGILNTHVSSDKVLRGVFYS